jgi:hypothetical protein
MLGLALLLFIVGVLYPLSFLPVPPEWWISFSPAAVWAVLWSLKGLILAVVLAVFLYVLGALWKVHKTLALSQDQLDKVRPYASVGSYSKSFEIREESLRARAGSEP